MRTLVAILALLVSSSAFSSGCALMTDGEMMYQRFFEIAYETGIIDGQQAFVTRIPSKAETTEGWQCIERASQIGNCSAIHIQELYYRHGVGNDAFGIPQNTAKADHFLGLKHELCSK